MYARLIGQSATAATPETASTIRVNTSHFHELFDPDIQDRPYQHRDAGRRSRYLVHSLCRLIVELCVVGWGGAVARRRVYVWGGGGMRHVVS